MTDALGLQSVFTYDAANRLTRVQTPAVNGVAQGTNFTYNANGDLTSQTDARGNVVTYEYDVNGNLTLQRDQAGNTLTRTYGSLNEPLSETLYFTPDPDGAGAATASQPATTRYVYDAENHLRSGSARKVGCRSTATTPRATSSAP